MKKIAAILFLVILSFNWIGYRFVFDYLENKHNKNLEAEFDQNEYNENELISIKTASSLPYYNISSTTFERWDGEIKIGGIQYKYVKRRFFNDSIELLCIPNITATKLKEARHDYFRLSNDLQSDQQGQKQDQGKLPVFKNLLSEYCEEIPDWNLSITRAKQLHQSSYVALVSQFIGDSPAQPPDLS